MIYIRLRGRAGNQLFIYALARNISLKANQNITFCTYFDSKKDSSFKNDLEEFDIPDNILFDDTFRFPWYANNDFLLTKIFRKLFPNFLYNLLKKFNVFFWLGETYKEISFDSNKDIFIDGFWQSEKYFIENYDTIFGPNFFRFHELSNYNKNLLSEIQKSEAVCITIRRGDYFSNPKVKKKYYICDRQYFEKSVSAMIDIVPHSRFFVFSDDIEWAKAELDLPDDSLFESGHDNISDKLFLMSNCKHFILSNSSFSWWAQELCSYKNKVVICPNYWYKDKRECDIMKESWIKI